VIYRLKQFDIPGFELSVFFQAAQRHFLDISKEDDQQWLGYLLLVSIIFAV